MLNNISDKISVIVPAYNIEAYLERCVNSILNQTYPNLEVIVVDDGSKDNTAKVAESLAKKDSRVKVISKANGGVTIARLTGVNEATGDWIGFVDGDDQIDSDMYERLLSNAKEHNADISHCGYKMVFPKGKIDYYYNTGKLVTQDNITGLKDLLRGDFVEPGLWNKIYKRGFFKEIISEQKLDTSIKINEDLLMNYLLFCKADKAVYEDFCPYHYMLREGSAATSKINENKLKDPLKVLKIIKNDCQHNPDLLNIINVRISANLISASTMSLKKNPELIKPYRKQARKELRQLKKDILKGNCSKQRKIATVWVSVWPWSYGFVHSVYAKISGVDKKYEVK